MWELDYKESWTLKNWCFWPVVLQMLERSLESSLDCKEIKPVNAKGNQSWIFIGTTDGEAETPILWPPNAKNRLIGKDPDAGKDWRLKDDRGWVDWMAPSIQWIWVYIGSGSWWWTGGPGMLQSMGSQRVGHDWVTDLNSCSHLLSTSKSPLSVQLFRPPFYLPYGMLPNLWMVA